MLRAGAGHTAEVRRALTLCVVVLTAAVPSVAAAQTPNVRAKRSEAVDGAPCGGHTGRARRAGRRDRQTRHGSRSPRRRDGGRDHEPTTAPSPRPRVRSLTPSSKPRARRRTRSPKPRGRPLRPSRKPRAQRRTRSPKPRVHSGDRVAETRAPRHRDGREDHRTVGEPATDAVEPPMPLRARPWTPSPRPPRPSPRPPARRPTPSNAPLPLRPTVDAVAETTETVTEAARPGDRRRRAAGFAARPAVDSVAETTETVARPPARSPSRHRVTDGAPTGHRRRAAPPPPPARPWTPSPRPRRPPPRRSRAPSPRPRGPSPTPPHRSRAPSPRPRDRDRRHRTGHAHHGRDHPGRHRRHRSRHAHHRRDHPGRHRHRAPGRAGRRRDRRSCHAHGVRARCRRCRAGSGGRDGRFRPDLARRAHPSVHGGPFSRAAGRHPRRGARSRSPLATTATRARAPKPSRRPRLATVPPPPAGVVSVTVALPTFGAVAPIVDRTASVLDEPSTRVTARGHEPTHTPGPTDARASRSVCPDLAQRHRDGTGASRRLAGGGARRGFRRHPAAHVRCRRALWRLRGGRRRRRGRARGHRRLARRSSSPALLIVVPRFTPLPRPILFISLNERPG